MSFATYAVDFMRTHSYLLLVCLAAASVALPMSVVADPDADTVHRLTGGLDYALAYTGEFASVTGGVEQGDTYLDNVDVTLEGDLERLFNIGRGTLFLHVLGNAGGSPSAYAGDLQAVSNIDAPDTWKIYELWYEHSWSEERYSLKGGLYDLNSEFDVIPTAQLFLNGSFGIGAEIAQTGENGPSIFPTTSLSIRGRAALAERAYLQAAVLDGVPGDTDNPSGTHIQLDRNDGLLLVTEVGRAGERNTDAGAQHRKLALGAWYYTSAVTEDAAGNAIRPRENHGLYALIDAGLIAERDDPEQGLSGFLRCGLADERVNELTANCTGGFVYTGPLPKRDQDHLGLAFAYAKISDHYREQMTAAGTPLGSRELAIELTYRAQLTPWLAVQPDYQWVIDPGADPTLADAHVFMLRFEVAL